MARIRRGLGLGRPIGGLVGVTTHVPDHQQSDQGADGRQRPAHGDLGATEPRRVSGEVQPLLDNESDSEQHDPGHRRDVEGGHDAPIAAPGHIAPGRPAVRIADNRAADDDRHQEHRAPEEVGPDTNQEVALGFSQQVSDQRTDPDTDESRDGRLHRFVPHQPPDQHECRGNQRRDDGWDERGDTDRNHEDDHRDRRIDDALPTPSLMPHLVQR